MLRRRSVLQCCVTFWVLSLNFSITFSDVHSEQAAISPHHSPENLRKVSKVSDVNGDSTELKKSSTAHSKTVARKGVLLNETDVNVELSNKSTLGNQPSVNYANHPASENNETEKTLLNTSHNAGINSPKNTSATIKVTGNKNDMKPVMKPLFTSDNSNADYNETSDAYSSDSNRFLTTFSLSVFIVFLIILIIVLFYRLKYKFSIHQNYRRVDYLIDGMYL